jgi:putative transposase
MMSNHVHLMVVPAAPDALARALGRTRGDYARWLHVRQRATGHLWQNRFYSCPLADRHLWAAMQYVEFNPVRAGLAERAWDWSWSSARAHITGRDERGLLDMAWWLERYSTEDWRQALSVGGREEALAARLREATRTGRPMGDDGFCREMECKTGRRLMAGKRGRRAQQAAPAGQMVIT